MCAGTTPASTAFTMAHLTLTAAAGCNCSGKVVALMAITIAGLASFLQALSFKLALQSELLFKIEVLERWMG